MIVIYPALYIIVETCMVVFIKLASVNEKIGYDPLFINLIAELIKLSFAIWIAYDEQELKGLRSISGCMALKFGVSNLLYAVNNNLFHLFMSWLNPAVFAVAINCFRTILTSALQQYISGPLTAQKYAACLCLLISFLATSIPDIMKASPQNIPNNSHLYNFWLMIGCAVLYSSISTCASLWQEKMLKESPNLMVANIINYSVGASFQLLGVMYHIHKGINVTRGLAAPMTQSIPFFMALSGISISLILRHFDNIVKLICSSVCVLFIHVIVKILKEDGKGIFNIPFLCGWLFTIPAAYLYNAVPDKTPRCFRFCDRSADSHISLVVNKVDGHDLSDKKKDVKPIDTKPGVDVGKRLIFAFTIVVTSLFLTYFIDPAPSLSKINIFGIMRRESVLRSNAFLTSQQSYTTALEQNASATRSCDLQWPDNSHILMSTFRRDAALRSKKFAFTNHDTGSITVYCPSKAYMLPPQQPSEPEEWREVNAQSYHHFAVPERNRWRHDIKHIGVPWSALAPKDEPYVWLKCDSYQGVNLLVKPPVADKYESRPPRSSGKIQKSLEDAIQMYSREDAQNQHSPVFDSVIVIYLDAVSKAKFNTVFPKSRRVLNSMMGIAGESNHQVFPLEKLHALGINSPLNYLPFFSGVSPQFTHEEFGNSDTIADKELVKRIEGKRHIWLNDVAEHMGYQTLFAYGGCQHYTLPDNSINLSKLWYNMESGGIQRQYMMETGNQEPAQIMWPGSAQCEYIKRNLLWPHNYGEYWLGHDLALAQYFDWLQTYYKLRDAKNHTQKSSARTFSTLIIEDLHDGFVTPIWDEILVRTLHQLFFSNASYMANTAVIFMADHGLHFGPEFLMSGGFLHNKLPFGYMILPRSYLGKHPEERSNIEHNAKQLLTSLDLRVTVLRWLTGRHWRNIEEEDRTVSAHKFGNDLLTSELSPSRDCKSAGIPQSFCGCGAAPCDEALYPILSHHLIEIAAYVNDQCISLLSNTRINLCKPLIARDLEIQKGQSCMEFDHLIKVIVSVRNRKSGERMQEPYLLSVTMLKNNSTNFFALEGVHVVSIYQHNLNYCSSQYKNFGIDIETLKPDHRAQFLDCFDTSKTFGTYLLSLLGCFICFFTFSGVFTHKYANGFF